MGYNQRLIRSVSNNPDDYDKKCMKFKFNFAIFDLDLIQGIFLFKICSGN